MGSKQARSIFYRLTSLGIFIFVSSLLLAQQPDNTIEGYVVSKSSGDPIAYANVFNFNSKSGTITNSEGFFSVGITSFKDSIRISFIGFRNV